MSRLRLSRSCLLLHLMNGLVRVTSTRSQSLRTLSQKKQLKEDGSFCVVLHDVKAYTDWMYLSVKNYKCNQDYLFSLCCPSGCVHCKSLASPPIVYSSVYFRLSSLHALLYIL